MKGIFNLDFINSLDINIWCKSELSKGLIRNTLLNSSLSFTLTPTYNSHIKKKKKSMKVLQPLLLKPGIHSSNMLWKSCDAMWIYTGVFLNLHDTHRYIGSILNTPRKFAYERQLFSFIEKELRIDKYSSTSWYVIGKIF